MAKPTDVVLSCFASVPSEVQEQFKRPTKFITLPVPEDQHYLLQYQESPKSSGDWRIGGWPHPLAAIFRRYGVTNPLRIAVLGFSEGCQGVGAILRSQDAGYVEHAMAFDGIHCAWSPPKHPNAARDNIEASCISTWKAAAAIAARPQVAIGGNPPGQHYLTITHSSITPPDFPSTSDTARAIMTATFEDPPEPDLPSGLIGQQYDPPWIAKGFKYDHDTNRYAAGQNGLVILGYDNLDPAGTADHVYQGNVVLRNVIEKLLVPRWNEQDPSAPTCGATGAVHGTVCNPVVPVVIPPDYFDHPQDASIDWAKFMPPIEPPSSSLGPFLLSMILGGGLFYGGWKAFQAIRRQT